MGVSRVDFNNETLIDISSDTVSADTLLNGVTAHSSDGESIVGNVITHNVIDNLTTESSEDALSAKQGKVLKGLVELKQDKLTVGTNISISADNVISATNSNSLIANNYDANKLYNANDYVIYNNNLYRCKNSCVGVDVTDTRYWEQTNVMGALNNAIFGAIGGSY